MEQIIENILNMDKLDASLKIVLVLLLGVLAFFFRRWKIKQAKEETEELKKKDIEEMQNNNQTDELREDSQASDDF
jgi:hypothetical protein